MLRRGDRRVQTAGVLAFDIRRARRDGLRAQHRCAGRSKLVCGAAAIAGASSIYQALLPEVVPRSAWGSGGGRTRRDDARRHGRRSGVVPRFSPPRDRRCW